MKVKILKGDQLLKEVEIGDEEHASAWIGRSRDCKIVLDDMQISRQYAEFIYDSGQWILRGNSEEHIPVINGTPQREGNIKDGDSIKISSFVLEVQIEETGIAAVEEKDEIPVEQESEAVFEEEQTQEEAGVEQDEGEIGDDMGFAEDAVETVQEVDSFPETGEVTSGEEEFYEGDNFEAEGSQDDEYALEETESSDGTSIIQSFAVFGLDIFGEYAPYDTYMIEQDETRIGRDEEKCQVILADPEASSVHAVIRKVKASLVLEDLNSSNGTILNGERINKKELSHGDEFIIGSTTFTLKLESDFIKKQEDHLMPVEKNQVVEVEEVVEDYSDEEDTGETPTDQSLVAKAKAAWQDPVKRKKIIYATVGLVMLWTFLDDGGEQQKVAKKKVKKKKERIVKKPEDKLKPEQREFVDSTYQLSRELFQTGKYQQSIYELDKIFKIVPNYKSSKALYQAAKDALKELEVMARKKRELEERIVRQKRIDKLLNKAEEAVKEKRVHFAEQLFSQIAQLDPENISLTQLKIELNAYKKEQERKALERAAQKAERKRQERALLPGKSFYTRKNWHSAIKRLEELLEKENNLDKDILEEANKMLANSKKNLGSIINPLSEKARTLKEGQNLKGAYENYMIILKHDPENVEALNEMDSIREKLRIKSRKIYREAIISESLSLFNQAREKFQEVQQVSPIDSEYYKKSTDKLKEYLE